MKSYSIFLPLILFFCFTALPSTFAETNRVFTPDVSQNLSETNAASNFDPIRSKDNSVSTNDIFSFSNLVDQVRGARDPKAERADPKKATPFIFLGAIVFTISCLVVLGILKNRYSRF